MLVAKSVAINYIKLQPVRPFETRSYLRTCRSVATKGKLEITPFDPCIARYFLSLLHLFHSRHAIMAAKGAFLFPQLLRHHSSKFS